MRRLICFFRRLLGHYKRKCPWCGITDVPIQVYNGDTFLGETVKLNPFYLHSKCHHCGLCFGNTVKANMVKALQLSDFGK